MILDYTLLIDNSLVLLGCIYMHVHVHIFMCASVSGA
jgi:hypothetical protein